jgi:hypothetical protein
MLLASHSTLFCGEMLPLFHHSMDVTDIADFTPKPPPQKLDFLCNMCLDAEEPVPPLEGLFQAKKVRK